jgi:hypothetical protein
MTNLKGNEASLAKFKPQWRNGVTKTIRVPVILADKILEYARELDELPIELSNPETFNTPPGTKPLPARCD